MVTEALLSFLLAIPEVVLGWLPDVQAPAWLTTTLPAAVQSIVSGLHSLDALLPVEVVAACLAALLAACTAAVAIKLSRMVLSLATGGGGSAA